MSSDSISTSLEKALTDNETAIHISNLSKVYQIYEKPGDRLKQSIFPRLKELIGLRRNKYYREFWALKDVTFEVKKGDAIGIIGQNGAGKSTLLKMISGILTPTFGTINIDGNIASLLELGSGFHPEFSGRENVYMNAKIYGLTDTEIEQRFEDIVRFSEIGSFIDQPIKTYSSGMVLRLAFAVISHIDADILIIDEAFAVGDSAFNQKCIRFIKKFRETGVLILVSHDLESIRNLCNRAFWLADGSICNTGNPKDVVDSYQSMIMKKAYVGTNNDTDVLADTSLSYKSSDLTSVRANILDFKIVNSSSLGQVISPGDLARIHIKAISNINMQNPILGFLCRNRLGQNVFGENTLNAQTNSPQEAQKGQIITALFEFVFPKLQSGTYTLSASVASGDLKSHTQHAWHNDIITIKIVSSQDTWGILKIDCDSIQMAIE